MRNNSFHHFEFGPVFQEMRFKDISYLELRLAALLFNGVEPFVQFW